MYVQIEKSWLQPRQLLIGRDGAFVDVVRACDGIASMNLWRAQMDRHMGSADN